MLIQTTPFKECILLNIYIHAQMDLSLKFPNCAPRHAAANSQEQLGIFISKENSDTQDTVVQSFKKVSNILPFDGDIF